MSELTALFQFAVRRHRIVTLWMIALALFGIATSLALSTLFAEYDTGGLTGIPLFFSLLPTGLAAMGLFDYGQEKDLMSPQTCCNEWVLRMPVKSWKIALVPVLLKSAWLGTVWTLFVWTVSGFGEAVPLFGPWLALSAIVTWLLVIAWNPVRTGWTRLISLAIGAPILFGLYGLVIHTGVERQSGWYGPSCLLAAVTCVLGLGALIWTTEQAKSSTSGRIPEQPTSFRFALPFVSRGSDRKRDLGGPIGALAWNDFYKTRPYINYVLLLGVLPAVVITTLFVPLTGQTIGLVIFLFMYLGAISVTGISSNLSGKNHSTLPPYMAVSPISTATIAWTRLFTLIAIFSAVGACCLLTFLGWSLSESNRSNWYNWASEQAALVGASESVVSIGIRLSIAIVLGTAIVLGGRLVSLLWFAMTGRSWVTIVAITIISVACTLLGGLFIWWFIQQTDWESTTASMMRALAWLPMLVVGLLTIKAFSLITATAMLSRSQLVSSSTIVKAIAIWIAVALTIAGAMFALIPDPRATFVWCLALTSLAIPLARVLILPVSLSLNRHR